MNQSESIKSIAAALLKVQEEMVPIEKNSENPFFKSDYASLDAIQRPLHKIIHKHGIVYLQLIDGEALTTLIIHASTGEFISATANLYIKDQTPQSAGSAITYQKRYALAAAFGIIISDEDDDGNAGSKQPMSPKTTTQTTSIPIQQASATFSERQYSKPAKATVTTTATPAPTYGERQYTCPTCKNTATIMSGVSKKNGKPYKALKCGADKTHIFWDSSQEYFDIVNGGTDDYGNATYQDTLES